MILAGIEQLRARSAGGVAVVGNPVYYERFGFAVLAVFLWAIIYSLQRGLDINCGCFGGDAATSDYHELIRRDVVLLAVTLGLLIHRWMVRRPAGEGTVPAA